MQLFQNGCLRVSARLVSGGPERTGEEICAAAADAYRLGLERQSCSVGAFVINRQF